MTTGNGTFDLRAVLECGWNVFRRRGYSAAPEDVGVNYQFLDQLAAAGINWLIVFWTNGPGFDAAWAEVEHYAHGRGIHIARAVYAFAAGGPEHSMAEPGAPDHLLRPSSRGAATALCPHDERARAWLAEQMGKRLAPRMDGVLIEPAREIGRNCLCDRCQRLPPHEWDAFVLHFLAETIRTERPDVKIMAHINMQDGTMKKEALALALRRHAAGVDHVLAWGVDQEPAIVEWLDADADFVHFARFGRYVLFPQTNAAGQPTELRVAAVFRGCSLSAERGKTAYIFDYRMFGGVEFSGRSPGVPSTRSFARLPASLAVIGAAMRAPYANMEEQQALLASLRAESEWDLDDPELFYLGSPQARAQ